MPQRSARKTTSVMHIVTSSRCSYILLCQPSNRGNDDMMLNLLELSKAAYSARSLVTVVTILTTQVIKHLFDASVPVQPFECSSSDLTFKN